MTTLDTRDDHSVADEWREAVLVCQCGWRGAEQTKTAVRRSWLQHIAKVTRNSVRADGKPCGKADWITPHICKDCGQTYTPVEGHICPGDGINVDTLGYGAV